MKPSAKASFWKVWAGAAVVALALSISSAAGAQQHGRPAGNDFADVARWAEWFESPERAKWQKPDEVVSALGLKPGETVVDIGAGTGYFARRFAKAVGPSGYVLGLDLEPKMVEYMEADARKLGATNYHARVTKPGDPGLAPRFADVVFFCDVLHHVENRTAYFRKVAPALKPAGRVVVVDFRKDAPIGPASKMRVPPSQMIDEFSKAGYRLLREHHLLPYQYFLEFTPVTGG